MPRLAIFLLAAFVVPAAAAQTTCRPDGSKSEAKLLAFFAGPLALSSVPDVAVLERGEVKLAGELAFLPTPPASMARSSGFCGFNKAENSDLAPVFPRPRLAIGLGAGFVGEVSFLPPINVADASPHMGGFAISWTPIMTLPFADARMTFRAHTTIGGIDGPITCPRSALQDTNEAEYCYGLSPSDDTYEPNAKGLEALAHATTGEWGWLVGVGLNTLSSRLRVKFVDWRGFIDNNVVEIDLTRFALTAGGSWQAGRSLALSAQVYSVPGDATTARLGFAWRLR